ncbi:hypothetical protein LIPSTDRAFT_251044 [Lipomyces starkeyi NRRL Y-11557]|uniref:Uncharacterized protein n=1 Tax=Lipomyces starkeyi NRRL Y-11557 TaxID=675824 RepID=A0A1E3Q9E9_LIPST|nr:hypothetical protein LIPSTDRAFT_251044 [Lipomyces starkeyi NRRL Y-11557]
MSAVQDNQDTSVPPAISSDAFLHLLSPVEQDILKEYKLLSQNLNIVRVSLHLYMVKFY